ncbi:myoneurin-like isoform X3 [Aricia agestis]|uniref:myoneurin-like isoform X3 n=1 Tax=Aricia agestis TaxID=91739 RepID=UPI001C2048B0|nr:myoneurin-like isoform X3 [Aricia agestis]
MEFQETVVKDSPGLCRCCLSEGCYKELGAEYTWFNETEIYADMLLDCFDISISQHVDGPNGPNRLICEVCITRLRDACEFKKQVLESEKKFINMVCKGEFSKTVLVYKDPVKVELKDNLDTEYLDEDLDLDNDDLPEKIEIETPLDNADLTASVSAVKKKRGRPKKTLTEEEKPTPKKAKLEDKPRTSKGAKLCSTVDKAKSIKQRNVEYVLEYSNATPFLWYLGYYRCFFCLGQTKDPNTLRDHTLQAHQLDNLELIIRDRFKGSRRKEDAVKIDATDLMCIQCPQAMNSLEELVQHLIIAHDVDYDVSEQNCLLPFKLDRERPSCGMCNLVFSSFESLLRHANQDHLAHHYICDVCGMSFRGEQPMAMHKRYYHKDGGHNCNSCNASFNTLQQKMSHENNVHGENTPYCSLCSETFKSVYLKKRHLANVHRVEELRVKCPYCPRIYPTKGLITRHVKRVHLKEKNVQCSVCSEKFFAPYDLKMHMAKHTGDRRHFLCSVCGKKFIKKIHLDYHILTHSDKKPWSCPVCGKGFTYRHNMKTHLKNTHLQNDAAKDVIEAVMKKNDRIQILDNVLIG